MSRIETIGDCTLYLGDCLEIIPTLGKVDAVVTDPPYFLPASHSSTRKHFARSLSSLSMLEHFYRDLFGEVRKLMNDDAVLYVFCDGQSYPVFYVQLYEWCKRVCPLIWDKKIAYNGYTWRHQHELIAFAELPSAPPLVTGDGDILPMRGVPAEERQHPAEKPVELLRILLEKHPAASLILDPFMGSGTTGVACVNLGRKFIGIEIEPKYFDIACRRIEEAYRQPRLFAEPAPKPTQEALL